MKRMWRDQVVHQWNRPWDIVQNRGGGGGGRADRNWDERPVSRVSIFLPGGGSIV